ncbi:uncharacterized protein LOC131009786 [Salvia miltiorrhiza]|uniref:uncharacterized protein LOC131009786 n=1 Tax=Salvia miltiorrhiza TaxID=226208 RepID=UPI0025AC0F7D|nr:uncharacterized protein LOC131009786 [Salvia miltiorrhiza]
MVSTRFSFWVLDVIRDRLSLANICALRLSSIGHLVDMADLQFQGQLYIAMCRMLRNPSNPGCLTYNIGHSLVDFGPGDHALVSGLKMTGSKQLPASSQFHATVFKGVKKLSFSDIQKRFLKECDRSRGNSELCLRLALLCILYGVVMAKDRSTRCLDLGYMHLMDDMDKFNEYRWGRVTYDELLLRTFSAKACINGYEGKDSKLRIEARGFVFVLQAWAYEVIPELASFCAKSSI